jgi:hypothetical protein
MHLGGCLCGHVRYEATGPLTGVTYCHCSKCRRWHGHVGAYTAVDREHFRLLEDRGLKWFTVSPTIRRGFCVDCGSSLLWDESSLPKMAICAGTLDTPSGTRERAHIYVGSRGDYYEIADDLPKHDAFPGS